jgi:hypothetical protein
MSRIAEQRRRAAALGTEVRSRRAAVKRLIASAEVDLPELLRADPDHFYTHMETAEEIPIGQLLRSVPGIGPVIARQITVDLNLNPTRPMAELTPSEREQLATEIERT